MNNRSLDRQNILHTSVESKGGGRGGGEEEVQYKRTLSVL